MLKSISAINKFLYPEIIIGLMILCGLLSSCNIPKGVVDAKIAAIENNLNQLEKLVDNKVEAETIETLKQQLLEISNTINNSGVIKYSGAGWVLIGMALMSIIFLSAIGIAIKFYLKAKINNNLLILTTKSISNTDPSTQRIIKNQIESETSNGGSFTAEHKKLLLDFTINDTKNKNRLQEILRVREVLVDDSFGDNTYGSTDSQWTKAKNIRALTFEKCDISYSNV